MKIKPKMNKRDLQTKKLLHSKGNQKKKNETTTHRMGENICKYFQPTREEPPKFANSSYGLISLKKNSIKKWAEDLKRLSPKKTCRWPRGT